MTPGTPRHPLRTVARAYLRGDQYADGRNLDARINLHRRFSANQYDWFRWLFDHLDLPATGAVLELGCGTGVLWGRNADRVPETWDITLSDFSPGMVAEARRALASWGPPAHCVTADAQAIPFADGAFNGVIANHMLYHVPDRARAIAEIHRVLRPGGRLYASTIGRDHLREIFELAALFDPEFHWSNDEANQFGLDNGAQQLSQRFSDVRLNVYEDSLCVTEAEPLVAFILSSMTNAKAILTGERLTAFRAFVAQTIRRQPLHVTKAQGLFAARR